MDQTKTTGTDDQEPGDALESAATTDSPENEASRDAESGGEKTDWKALALSYKSKVEEFNELQRQLKEQQDAKPQPPVAEGDELQEEERFEYFVQNKDPVAKRVRMLERALYLKEQLDEMPAEERDGVKTYFRKNAWRLGDMKAARAELLAPKLEAENKKLAERLALLEKPPDPDVMKAPPTHGREIGARETRNKQITEDQFDREAEQILVSQGPLAEMKYRMENAGRIKR